MSGISDFLENTILNMVFNSTAPVFNGGGTSAANVYVQLHTGDPTDVGNVAVASNSTRKLVTFATASGITGQILNDVAAVTWTNVPAAEEYAWVSLWDHVSSGNCLWTGEISTHRTVAIGDNFTFDVAAISVTLT